MGCPLPGTIRELFRQSASGQYVVIRVDPRLIFLLLGAGAGLQLSELVERLQGC